VGDATPPDSCRFLGAGRERLHLNMARGGGEEGLRVELAFNESITHLVARWLLRGGKPYALPSGQRKSPGLALRARPGFSSRQHRRLLLTSPLMGAGRGSARGRPKGKAIASDKIILVCEASFFAASVGGLVWRCWAALKAKLSTQTKVLSSAQSWFPLDWPVVAGAAARRRGRWWCGRSSRRCRWSGSSAAHRPTCMPAASTSHGDLRTGRRSRLRALRRDARDHRGCRSVRRS
jgi:hypothetical protein